MTNQRLDRVEKDIIDNSQKIKSIKSEITEIKESLNFHGKLIHKKKKKNNLVSYDTEKNFRNGNHKDNNEYMDMKKKLREMEDSSRRNNLRINGIKETENENWNVSKIKVKKSFEECLGLKDIKIERALRTGFRDKNKLRTIVLKLLGYKDKVEILKKSVMLKGKNIYINEDFCAETNKIRKTLREEMKVARQSGKYAFINYDNLVIRD
ncbi:uncharacterized protein LOC136081124 [Hydra vulgaris]|uniref:Uncharacterized protein LOC136081124 n=1 Tax=Hydra vulgaris TaxID=6087 RepID=A0ABM4BZ09_HYDVU